MRKEFELAIETIIEGLSLTMDDVSGKSTDDFKDLLKDEIIFKIRNVQNLLIGMDLFEKTYIDLKMDSQLQTSGHQDMFNNLDLIFNFDLKKELEENNRYDFEKEFEGIEDKSLDISFHNFKNYITQENHRFNWTLNSINNYKHDLSKNISLFYLRDDKLIKFSQFCSLEEV